MDSSVVFPTPEPAKMPMRCAAQSGVNRSMARTPVGSGRFTRDRSIAGGGSASSGIARAPLANGPFPSMGCPRALMTRSFQSSQGRGSEVGTR